MRSTIATRAHVGILALVALAGAGCGAGQAAPAAPSTRPAATVPPTSGPTAAPSSTAALAASAAPTVVVSVPDEPDDELALLWSGCVTTEAFMPQLDPKGRVWSESRLTETMAICDPATGRKVDTWGTAGDGDGQVRQGGGINTVGFRLLPDGSFYVADTGNRRVERFDAKGAFVRQWGSFGRSPDQFVMPITIALDGTGTVYVYDDEVELVKRFTPDGASLGASPCGGPLIDSDSTGTVLAADQDTATVNRCLPDGTVVPWVRLDGTPGFVSGIHPGPHGETWITLSANGAPVAKGRLLRLDPSGKLLHAYRTALEVEDFSIAPDGSRIYASAFQHDGVVAYAIPAH
jgi:hypothetical protein